MTAVSDSRSGATPAGAPMSRDPRGARWAYLAGATGAAANALLVTFFASIPAAGRENPFGPANDIVGSVATACMIPAAVAIGRHLPPRGRLRALHTATLGALGVATAAGPLLVAGVLPFKVSAAASTGAFGVQLAWIGLGSGWLGRNAGLPGGPHGSARPAHGSPSSGPVRRPGPWPYPRPCAQCYGPRASPRALPPSWPCQRGGCSSAAGWTATRPPARSSTTPWGLNGGSVLRRRPSTEPLRAVSSVLTTLCAVEATPARGISVQRARRP